MEDLSFFSYFLLRRAPVLLLALAGIILALVRWKRHPKVSLITVIGLVFFLVESLIYSTLLYRLPRLFGQRWVTLESYEIYFTVLYVLDDIAYALVIVLLVTAALIQRKIQSPTKA